MKKYKKIVINGRFLTQKITGVQRYALEITKSIDNLSSEFSLPIEIVVPLHFETQINLKNIKLIHYGTHNGIIWEQIDFCYYIKKHKALSINFCNSVPLFAPKGIVCIHDITYKVNPQFITTKHLKLTRLWNLLQYYIGSKKSVHLFTVSEFSKNQIIETYKISSSKITVAYNGWQHFNTKIDLPDSLDSFPMLKDENYYFSLSTMAKNKNFSWIVESAFKNPNSTYAVAGNIDIKKLGNNLGSQIPKNMYCLGYVSDNDAKILMKHCKAFLFPSLYEGFGIPPLEAMAMGAKVICSNTSCLPEIFENCVHYINPYDSNINLDYLLNQKIEEPNKILNKYSWKKTAQIYKDEIFKLIK